MEGDNLAKSAGQIVVASRAEQKITGEQIVHSLLSDFMELHAGGIGSDDPAVIGGIGLFHGQPVTVVAIDKGDTIEDKVNKHFGCPTPAGYRKSLYLMKQAAKFHRPVLCFVNTPGAYPGQEAEETGQGAAIAQNILEMSQLPTPIITVIFGEGGSGGALALASGDQVWMLENSTYSILSPEGFASILWKDSSRANEAAQIMQLTPRDLQQKHSSDGILEEPNDHRQVVQNIDRVLQQQLSQLQKMPVEDLLKQRYERYRKF